MMGTALGIRTVSSMMQTRIASQDKAIKKHQATTIKRKAATRKFGTRLATRTKRVAAKSIAAIPAESIPFIGVAVLVADTGYELYAACETVMDLDQLYFLVSMLVRTDLGGRLQVTVKVLLFSRACLTTLFHSSKVDCVPLMTSD
jgi:hypothetical protein